MIRAFLTRRSRRPVLLAVILTAVLALPAGFVLANHQFTDVPTSNPFHADIDALVDSGVTAGCASGRYCPTSNVTREQMAAFLNRLGALGPGKTPVVNAKSTDGWSLGCSGSTAFSQGMCFETTNRALTDLYTASEACAAAGRFLPEALHLRAAALSLSTITLDAAGEWSSTEFFDDTNEWQAFAVHNDGFVEPTNDIASRRFRCATLPMSLDAGVMTGIDQAPSNATAGPGGTVGE